MFFYRGALSRYSYGTWLGVFIVFLIAAGGGLAFLWVWKYAIDLGS